MPRMRRRHQPAFLCATMSALLAACGSAPPAAAGAAAAERDYTLVYLVTGSRTDLSQAESNKVFAGHFANMERLAREGHLLVAGPFGKQKSDPKLRGIFVLATGDRGRARELAQSDPGVQAGVFELEFHALATNAPLPRLLAKELADRDAERAAGRTTQPAERIRGYVLLIAADGERAFAALRGHPAVLLLGRLDAGQAFAVVDAADRAAAERALDGVRARLGEHRLEEWAATRNVALLPQLADA
jgi:uncharacterized protein YciI